MDFTCSYTGEDTPVLWVLGYPYIQSVKLHNAVTFQMFHCVVTFENVTFVLLHCFVMTQCNIITMLHMYVTFCENHT